MADQIVTGFFNEIYDETYRKTLRYVTSKCGNTHDIADIVQEIYTEVYSVLVSKGTRYINNREAFVMQVAKAKMYRHYSLAGRFKNLVPLFDNIKDEEVSLADLELSESEVADGVINKILSENIWKRLSKKPEGVKKIFYLYYSLDLTIADIAKELKMTQSNVKNKLFRTVTELREEYETALL